MSQERSEFLPPPPVEETLPQEDKPPIFTRRRALWLFGVAATAALAKYGDFLDKPFFFSPIQPDPVPVINRSSVPQIVFKGDPNKSQIYLTVDDGWNPEYMREAFEIAERHGVKLTFFPVGKVVRESPSLYRDIFEAGHGIENHSDTHQIVDGKTKKQIIGEIERQRDTVQIAVGHDHQQFFFRPSGGSGVLETKRGMATRRAIPNPLLLEACAELGYHIAMWTIDSKGYRHEQTPNSVLRTVTDTLSPGAIVLQHAIPPDVNALSEIIKEAKKKNLEMVTMREGLIMARQLS